MKYKVIFINTAGGSGSESGNSHTFYTRSQAAAACEAWGEVLGKTSYLWDGSTWTTFLPTP
jgi:hypothetical protein